LFGCSVDTSHLSEPVDVSRWATPARSEPFVKQEVLSRPPSAGPGTEGAATEHEVLAPRSSPIELVTVLRLAGSGAVDIDLARAAAMEAAHLAEAEQARALPFLAPRLDYFRHEGHIQDVGGVFFDVDKQNAFAGTGVAVVLQPAEAIYRSLAARRRADAASANYRANIDATLLRAAGAYFALAESHAREAIATDDVQAARELLRVEQVRQEAGAGLPAAVARARARVAEAEGQLEQARGEVEQDTAELVSVLSLEPGTVLLPSVADAVVTMELVDATEEAAPLLARAFSQHPEIAAARYSIEAAAAEEDQTRWGWLIPEIKAGATLDGFGPDFGGLADRENYFLGAQWKLDFGLPSRHEAHMQRHAQTTLRLQALRDRVAATVVKSRAQVLASKARVEAGRREVDAAVETLKLVQARHAEGTDLQLQVLDAQAALTRARLALVSAITDHNTAQYSLLRAVGGPR
jgi:outer membrane protein TolC